MNREKNKEAIELDQQIGVKLGFSACRFVGAGNFVDASFMAWFMECFWIECRSLGGLPNTMTAVGRWLATVPVSHNPKFRFQTVQSSPTSPFHE